MHDVFVGLLAIAVGALFAARGYVAMRLIIPFWGAFAGFMLGAGIVAGAGDAGFLRTGVAWLVGLLFAVVFFALAYLYFEVSIAIAMGAVGFALGTSLMALLGIRWAWLVAIVGIAAGVLLAIIAIVGDLPGTVLVVLTAFGGASAIVFGLMLLFDTVSTSDITRASFTERLDESWWWWALYVAIAVVGIVVQSRMVASLRTSARAQWQGTAATQTAG